MASDGKGYDIEQVVSKCHICLECQPSNPREPMISEKPATRPWESISTDLFTWEGEDYLLVVDSYSHFIEIACLSKLQAKLLLCTLNQYWLTMGFPELSKVIMVHNKLQMSIRNQLKGMGIPPCDHKPVSPTSQWLS